MENCAVNEVRFGVPIVVVVPVITSARVGQLWCRYLDQEFTKCFAQCGLIGNGSLVSLECQGRVEARDILGQQFASNLCSFLSTKGCRIPRRLDEDICVVALYYVDVLDCCVANDRAIVEDVDIDKWDVRRVFGRIGEVDVCLEVDRSLASAQDFQLANSWLQIAKATAWRDRCNLVSFGAADLNTQSGCLTFDRNDSLRRHLFDYQLPKDGGKCNVNKSLHPKHNGLATKHEC